MARYINADALMKKLNEDPIGQTIVQRYNIDGFIEAFPTADVVEKERYDILLEHANILAEEMRKYQTADVVERKKGKWDTFFSDSYKVHEIGVECSFCGYRTQERTNYCPNCGADMRKESGTE